MVLRRSIKKGSIDTWNLFGLHVEKVGYQGQVLPVLVASFVLAKIELFLRKRIPDGFQLLIVAPVALLVTGFLAFIVIGPITFAIGNVITDAVVWLFKTAPFIGGLVYGGLYAPLVITGMHHTFLAVDLQLIGSVGSTFLWPMVALSNIAQGSAAFAIMVLSKDDEKLKGLSLTSGVSAWLGITEPAMFGVNLRFRFAFISAVIGSAIAGVVISVAGVKAASVGIGVYQLRYQLFHRAGRLYYWNGYRNRCAVSFNVNARKASEKSTVTSTVAGTDSFQHNSKN